jgi:hypothetical protein
MSNDLEDQELIRELGRELRRRSGQPGLHPTGLDEVRGRARRIRRRRQAASGLVAAAVLAVAVPVGVNIVGTTSSTDPGFADRPGPTSVTTPSPAPTKADSLALDRLSPGDASTVPYVVSSTHTLVIPEGQVTMPAAYTQIVPYDRGWLALAEAPQGGMDGLMLDGDFTVLKRFPAGEALAVDADGEHVAYIDYSEGYPLLVSAPTDGTDPVTWRLPVEKMDGPVPVGYAGPDSVVVELRGGMDTGRAFVAGPGGTVEPLNGFTSIDGVSEDGLVAGQVSYDTSGSQYGVLDLRTGSWLWETRKFSLGAFSPDGRYLIAGIPDYDTWGSPSLAILDARTQQVLAQFAGPKDRVAGASQATWEDDDSVVAAYVDGASIAVVRANLDGSAELASEIHPQRDLDLALWLAGTSRF